MMPFEMEWMHYLEAFRLHQGLTRASNLETRRLLKQSIDIALKNSRLIPRSYGLLSFTILNAWLCDWIDQTQAEGLLAEAMADLERIQGGQQSLSAVRADLQALKDTKPPLDPIVQAVVVAYATMAVTLDGSDCENHWSMATANLYSRKFGDAVSGYTAARSLADKPEGPTVTTCSLSVDIADTRFFIGNEALENSDAAYCAAIAEAIAMTQQAIADSPNDSKRHRWNWTLGWAYYELAGFQDPAANYAKSLAALQQIRTPHDLIRKNLIATYVGLKDIKSAAEIAAEFRANNPAYRLAVENRWPYRSQTQLDRWKNDLRAGGLPD